MLTGHQPESYRRQLLAHKAQVVTSLEAHETCSRLSLLSSALGRCKTSVQNAKDAEDFSARMPNAPMRSQRYTWSKKPCTKKGSANEPVSEHAAIDCATVTLPSLEGFCPTRSIREPTQYTIKDREAYTEAETNLIAPIP